jgi:flagellar basal-body rod protein FlgF
MDASGYVTLSRQSGLLNQMQSIANNIANSATIGFRREGLVFSE